MYGNDNLLDADITCLRLSMLQYMVVYQCIVAAAETAMYITDGSHLTNLQVSLS